MGTHAELLALSGHYYRLYTQQFRQELVEQIDPLAALFEDEAEGTPVGCASAAACGGASRGATHQWCGGAGDGAGRS